MKARARKVTIGSPLTKRLRELGCTYCAECRAFMWPEHATHIDIVGDSHHSRYVLVGDYGSVRAVERDADAAELVA